MDLWLFSGHRRDCRHPQHALLAISSKRLDLMTAGAYPPMLPGRSDAGYVRSGPTQPWCYVEIGLQSCSRWSYCGLIATQLA